MNALAAASPWYCVVLRRASAWLADTAQRLETPALDVSSHEYVHRCDAAEERLREMRMRYY